MDPLQVPQALSHGVVSTFCFDGTYRPRSRRSLFFLTLTPLPSACDPSFGGFVKPGVPFTFGRPFVVRASPSGVGFAQITEDRIGVGD